MDSSNLFIDCLPKLKGVQGFKLFFENSFGFVWNEFLIQFDSNSVSRGTRVPRLFSGKCFRCTGVYLRFTAAAVNCPGGLCEDWLPFPMRSLEKISHNSVPRYLEEWYLDLLFGYI